LATVCFTAAALERRSAMGTIRLSCLHCDNDDCDGVDEIPADWKYVDEVQSYEDSMDDTVEDGQWWTHLGVCPDCIAIEEGVEEEESTVS
jgi:hypothetical protein